MILLAKLSIPTNLSKIKIKVAKSQKLSGQIILNHTLDKSLSALYDLPNDGVEL
jgi:hypothetical protein